MEKTQVQKKTAKTSGHQKTQVTPTHTSENPTHFQEVPNRNPFGGFSAGDRLTPVQLLQLQQTHGNRAVGRLIQAKLTVGRPDDQYEREADRVADTVMRMPEPTPEEEETPVQTKPLAERITPLAQRAPQEEETVDEESMVQRIPETEEDKRVLQGPHEAFEGALEEEEPVIRRMPQVEEDEEQTIRQMPMAEEEEEESAVAMKPVIQRMPEMESEEGEEVVVAAKHDSDAQVQRQVEEEEEQGLQAKHLPDLSTRLMPKPVRLPTHSANPQIQRVCTECKAEMQRQPESEEEMVQTKPLVNQQFVARTPAIQPKGDRGSTSQVSPATAANIQSQRGGGSPLPRSARSFFEPRFAADFSQVRVHADGEAARLSQNLNAQAFTRGQDVFFGVEKYSPESGEGKRLLAHELTHVVQQNGRTSEAAAIQLNPDAGVPQPSDASVPLPAGVGPPLPPQPITLCTTHYEEQVLRDQISYWQNSTESGERSRLHDSIVCLVNARLQLCSTNEEVFDFLRSLPTSLNLINTEVFFQLHRLSFVYDYDLWIALNILEYGPEYQWPAELLDERWRRAQENFWIDEPSAVIGVSPQGRQIRAYFFAGFSNRRALIVGGLHGSELSAIQVAETLINNMRSADRPPYHIQPYYNVTIVPRLFPDNAALAESQPAQIGSRENIGRYTRTQYCPGTRIRSSRRQECFDPNRQFPRLGTAFDPINPMEAGPGGTGARGQRPEESIIVLTNLIQRFRPSRVVYLHAIRSRDQAGYFADPRTTYTGIALGYGEDRALAGRMAARARALGAKAPRMSTLYHTDPTPVRRGLDQPRLVRKGVSAGGWTSTAVCDPDRPQANRPALMTITVEVQTSHRIEDLTGSARMARGVEIEAHADALREIFLGEGPARSEPDQDDWENARACQLRPTN